MLAFFGVYPGMVVPDLSAGGGYTTELLARAAGPTGLVFGAEPAAHATGQWCAATSHERDGARRAREEAGGGAHRRGRAAVREPGTAEPRERGSTS